MCWDTSWFSSLLGGGGYGYGLGMGFGGGGGWLQDLLALKLLSSLVEEHDGEHGSQRPEKSSDRLIDNRMDLDGNGKYKKGSDGLLVFDFGNDGVSEEDLEKSKKLMSYLNDGEGGEIPSELKAFDNGDGVLTEEELKKANAQLWVDRNGDGNYDRGERFAVGVDTIESRAGRFKLKSLNLRTGASKTEVDLGE
jgi:hypothetical protein